MEELIMGIVEKSDKALSVDEIFHALNLNDAEDLRKLYFEEGSQHNLEYLKEERLFLGAKHKYKVILSTSQYPVSYQTDKGEGYRGIALDVLKKISHYTGFDFEIEYVDYFQQGLDRMVNEEADLLGGVVLNTQQAHSVKTDLGGKKQGSYTVPFYQVNLSIVGKKNTDMLDSDERLVIL